MMEFVISLFLLSQTMLGIQQYPSDLGPWEVTKNWDIKNNDLNLTLEAKINDLNCSKNNTLIFPRILYGVQTVTSNKFRRSINQPLQPKFVFSQIKVHCNDLLILDENDKIVWTVDGYSKYFSNFSSIPYVSRGSEANLSINGMYLSATISLAFLALILLIAFINESNILTTSSVSLSALFLSLYFLWNQSGVFGITWSLINIHKTADIFLFLGFFSLMFSFYTKKMISSFLIKLLFFTALIGGIIILVGESGDEVQIGTSLPFLPVLLCLAAIMFRCFKDIFTLKKYSKTLELLFALIFSILTIKEMLIFSGSTSMASLFPVGLLFGYLIFSLSINQKIRDTYRERDDLLQTMELKVIDRTNELSQALKDKEKVQAELIQSAKLASLGTFSAGIAHEINNSTNYVNACIIGLSRQISLAVPKDSQNLTKINKLLETISHGSKVTTDIVKSLRSYTGLNQANMKNIEFNEIINSVTTIARSSLVGINVQRRFDPEITVYCSVVGINQVIMNLITNAADSINKEGGEIIITASKDSSGNFHTSIADNGPGIDKSTLAKIFDPFFTTKDVGHGTGLGLYIVKSEIEKRHRGKVKVTSILGKGTTFDITMPPQNIKQKESA